MPRFTPWPPSDEPEQVDFDVVVRAVLRPSLRLAFPLPRKDDPGDERFLSVLAELRSEPTGQLATVVDDRQERPGLKAGRA